ncbi:MAG: Fructose-bisphosphate aldolase class II, partial [uncultured Solirubrobacteraceae bacterium]
AARDHATAARRGRRRGLRRRGLQRQQPRADPGHHGGRPGDAVSGDRAGVARRAQVRRRQLPLPHDARGGRDLPRHPRGAAPGSRQLAGDVHQRDRAGVHERDDGRIPRRGRQDAPELRGQRRGYEEGRRPRPRARRHGRGRAGHARRHGGRRRLRRDQPDRPRAGGGVRRAHGRRRPRGRDRHEPRRLQVLARPRRRHPGDGDHRGHPPPPARHAHRHARLLERPAGHRRAPEGGGRRGRRRLRRADLGDPARHRARRAQGQHRHRRPPGDHRVHARALPRQPRRLGSARRRQGGARRPEADLHAAHAGARHGRPRRRLQADVARGHGRALCLRRALGGV